MSSEFSVNSGRKGWGYLPASQLPDPLLLSVFDYWSRLRSDRVAPARAEVDPIDMPRAVLPNLMLTEVRRTDAGRRYYYRLVGSRITELAGLEATWRFLDEALPEAGGYRDYILGLYDALVDGCQPLYSCSSYLTAEPTQQPERLAHRLMLPLADGDGTVTHVLAAQVFQVRRGVSQKPFLAADTVTYGDTRVVCDG